jgi:hypothetical protein
MRGPSEFLLFLLEFSAFALTEVDHERSNYPRSRGKGVPNSVFWSISDTSSDPFVTPRDAFSTRHRS